LKISTKTACLSYHKGQYLATYGCSSYIIYKKKTIDSSATQIPVIKTV